MLDRPVGLQSFGDAAVARPAARRLMELVEAESSEEGDGLLAGRFAVEIALDDGTAIRSELDLPPGAPERPMTGAELAQKVRTCAGELADEVSSLRWDTAAAFMKKAASARPAGRANPA